MTKEYYIEGMTCSGCAATIQTELQQLPGIISAIVQKATNTATISTRDNIDIDSLQSALTDIDPKYRINTIENNDAHDTITDDSKSWLKTYQPIFIIFAYLTAITLTIQIVSGGFDLMQWMRHFMAGFFLTFSFFKMMDLRGFASSYAMYDIIAQRWSSWGYVYAFIELGLGLAFLTGFVPVLTNLLTLMIMTVSIIGVIQSVMNKRTIQCACLGAIFDLPMSTITIIEDGLMILMSAYMLLTYL